jgi:DMSO/TMAO reductase YedYZ molybdopterin-dependent catalytic subunit
VLSGVVSWALNDAQAWPLYDAHRALGVAIILILGWKQAIVLRSLRRRVVRPRLSRSRLFRSPAVPRDGWDRSVLWGSIAALGLLVTLGLGLAWTLNLISFDLLWGYSPLSVHVIVGLGLLPFVGWHMVVRRRANQVSAVIPSRRTLLRVTGLSLGTLVGWQALEQLAPDVRRPSGSKAAPSFSGNLFPAEIWLFDSVPLLHPATWRLRVGEALYGLPDLERRFSPRQVQAVLDCTSGWWSEQVWRGFGVLDVLSAAGTAPSATRLTCTSVTGHQIVLPLAELETAILATHVGAEVLSPGHGYPLRLVVPGRRGYQWVKWVDRLEAS